MAIFNGFHWPTFFLSLTIFIIAVNIWNVVKYTIARERARARVKQSEAIQQKLLQKLKAGSQEINDLTAKIKQPKS